MNALGTVWRLLPQSWRRGAAYREAATLAAAAETWSSDHIRGYQLKALRRVLHVANQTIPFYQQRFAEAGFQPEYVQDYEHLAACPILEPGDRARLPSTPQGNPSATEQGFRETLWQAAGYREGARTAVVVHLASAGSAPTDSGIRLNPWRNELTVPAQLLRQGTVAQRLAPLLDFRPQFLRLPADAGAVDEGLAAALRDAGTLRAVFCGPDPLPAAERDRLLSWLGCPVVRWFETPDGLGLAAETNADTLCYFAPYHGYTEFAPPDEDGWREIIVTSFGPDPTPLIRARTGRFAKVAQHLPEGLSAGHDAARCWSAATEIR